jgi:hypothetical protein
MSFRKKLIIRKNSVQFRNYTIQQGDFHMNFQNQKGKMWNYEF